MSCGTVAGPATDLHAMAAVAHQVFRRSSSARAHHRGQQHVLRGVSGMSLRARARSRSPQPYSMVQTPDGLAHVQPRASCFWWSPLWTRNVQHHPAAYSADVTHSLAVYRRIAFCTKCWEMQRACVNQRLRQPCRLTGPSILVLSAYKLRAIRRLKQGRHPYGSDDLFDADDKRTVHEPGPEFPSVQGQGPAAEVVGGATSSSSSSDDDGDDDHDVGVA